MQVVKLGWIELDTQLPEAFLWHEGEKPDVKLTWWHLSPRVSFGISGLAKPMSWSFHQMIRESTFPLEFCGWVHQLRVTVFLCQLPQTSSLGPWVKVDVPQAPFSGMVKRTLFLKSGGLHSLSVWRYVRQLLFWMYFSRGNHHKSVRLCWLRYFSPFQISYCSFHVYCFLYASLIASFEAL